MRPQTEKRLLSLPRADMTGTCPVCPAFSTDTYPGNRETGGAESRLARLRRAFHERNALIAVHPLRLLILFFVFFYGGGSSGHVHLHDFALNAGLRIFALVVGQLEQSIGGRCYGNLLGLRKLREELVRHAISAVKNAPADIA